MLPNDRRVRALPARLDAVKKRTPCPEDRGFFSTNTGLLSETVKAWAPLS